MSCGILTSGKAPHFGGCPRLPSRIGPRFAVEMILASRLGQDGPLKPPQRVFIAGPLLHGGREKNAPAAGCESAL